MDGLTMIESHRCALPRLAGVSTRMQGPTATRFGTQTPTQNRTLRGRDERHRTPARLVLVAYHREARVRPPPWTSAFTRDFIGKYTKARRWGSPGAGLIRR